LSLAYRITITFIPFFFDAHVARILESLPFQGHGKDSWFVSPLALDAGGNDRANTSDCQSDGQPYQSKLYKLRIQIWNTSAWFQELLSFQFL
jgi:hypothetical protein